MKKIAIKLAIIGIIVISLVIAIVSIAKATAPKQHQTPKIDLVAAVKVNTDPNTLDHPQKAWLGVIEWCESGGKPGSVNPKDKDGTPSYGILQFKPSTFFGYAKRYGVPVTDYMNPDQQEAIMTQLILHSKDIDWHQQFPGCTAKNGPPPA